MSGNDPKNQHYLPQFLLRKWAGADDKVRVWRRDRKGKLFNHFQLTKNVGAENHLWTLAEPIPGDPLIPIDRFVVERKLFQAIDTKSGNILEKLLQPSVRLSPPDWVQWIVFLRSLRMRLPEHIQLLIEVTQSNVPEVARRLDAEGVGAQDGFTAQQALQEIQRIYPHWITNAAKESIPRYIYDEQLLLILCRMSWAVKDVSRANNRLIISDWSVSSGPDFQKIDYYMALPLSPTKILFAAYLPGMVRGFQGESDNVIVKGFNENGVGRAKKFVVGDCQTSFLEKRFSPPRKI